MPNASKTLITLDGAGNPIIQDGTLNVSIGDGGAHSQYFQALRPGSTATSFEIQSWMHDLIQENARLKIVRYKQPLWLKAERLQRLLT